MTRSPGESPGLRQDIELLVRPSRHSLMPGDAEGLTHGRIGKDVVTRAAQLRRITHRAADGFAADAMPLLLSVNQEGGRLNALDWPEVAQMPGNMALGAAGEEALAELAGAAIGGQLQAVGLTWNLAPVCDTANWPSTAAVGTRAFGSDPGQVAVLAAALVRGLQASGVAATAKHFPGLGGVTADPHHAASVVDRLTLDALLPFRAAVEAGVACVMVGSHTIRALDERPALASARVIGILRNDLGFDGVVVSENLSIPAVHEPLGGLAKAAVAAVAAGVDVVMLDSEISRGHQPHDHRMAAVRRRAEVIKALTAAVEAGLISRTRIDEAAARVRNLHHRFGLGPTGVESDWAQANAAAAHAAERIATRSVTVVRGRHLLPLTIPLEALAVVRVPDAGQRRADSARYAPDLLPQLLGVRPPAAPGAALSPGGGAVVVYGYDTRGPAKAPSDAAREAARFTGRGRLVVQVALGDPDDLAGSPADVLVAAFSPHHASITAVVNALIGHSCWANGGLPVRGASW